MATGDSTNGPLLFDIKGLIGLLSGNLYSDTEMFVREIIQNSHDAIIERQTVDPSHAGAISIITERSTGTLIFRDNGCGMTRSEIINYLSTIGVSGKRWSQGEPEQMKGIIGQFGIGFLSAFVVANELAVETLSVKTGSEPLHWALLNESYKITLGSKREPGTDVIIRLSAPHLKYIERDLLARIVRNYVDFLPIPITINGGDPVNAMDAPWYLTFPTEAESKRAFEDFLRQRVSGPLLAVIPLDFDSPYPARGALWIKDPGPGGKESVFGSVEIYQSRMLVTREDRRTLPEWAYFVWGIIDSPAFTPTVARDAVINDSVHEAIKKSVGRVIGDTLQSMASVEPVRFQRFIQSYPEAAKQLAVVIDDLFDAIAEYLEFSVNITEGISQRTLTLGQYREAQREIDTQSPRSIYFVAQPGVSDLQPFLAANNRLVIYAADNYDISFLRRYAERHVDSIVLVELKVSEIEAFLGPLPDSERFRYVDLERHIETLFRTSFPQLDISVQTERFAPEEIPAVVTTRAGDQTERRLASLIGSGLESAFRDEIFNLLTRDAQRSVFHLNASNPLIQRLSQESFQDDFIQTAWLSIYNLASAQRHKSPTKRETEILHEYLLRALNKALDLLAAQRRLGREETERWQAASRPPHTRLFVMMPFGNAYKVVEQALRAVFEDEPYFFQIILARDRTLHQNLFKNVQAHMRIVDGFVADISDLNPNVMLELGIAEVDPLARPVFVLHRSGAPEPPADLRGRLYVEYAARALDSDGQWSELANELRQKFSRVDSVEQLLRSRNGRFLSVTYLRRQLGRVTLTQDELERVCRAFPTVDALQEASMTEIARRATLDRDVVRLVEQALRKVRQAKPTS
jgi:molecular chaperone HtpG